MLLLYKINVCLFVLNSKTSTQYLNLKPLCVFLYILFICFIAAVCSIVTMGHLELLEDGHSSYPESSPEDVGRLVIPDITQVSLVSYINKQMVIKGVYDNISSETMCVGVW